MEIYKIGQRVIVTKNLGPENHYHRYGKSKYYHGSSLREIPLESKGVVAAPVDLEDHYDVDGVRHVVHQYYVLIGEKFRHFHNQEITLDQAYLTERQEKLDSWLSSSLDHLLLDDAPVEKKDREEIGKIFEPSFNPREEFAVWVRQEFPELKRYAALRTNAQTDWYATLTEREEEIMDGVRKAYKHARETANSCVKEEFYDRFKVLKCDEMGRIHSAYYLEQFVSLIEQLSLSLRETEPTMNESLHHGTKLLTEKKKLKMKHREMKK